MPLETEFSLPVTINFEDTDAAGVVYYANYLAYMERARNAYLRSLGLSLSSVRDEHNVVFVVKEACVQYYQPARLDDVIRVTLKVDEVRGASVRFVHPIMRGEELLVTGRIRLVILRSDTFAPCKMPEIVQSALARTRIQ